MKTTKLYPLFGIGIALITLNTSAIAGEDDKMYPGALCQPSSNTNAISRPVSGGMFNASTSTQLWTCPIVRDIDAAGSIEFARITVSNTNVNCRLHSSTSTGAAHDTDLQPIISGASLIFGNDDANSVSSTTAGYYYFRCTVPGNSGVLTYKVSENDGED